MGREKAGKITTSHGEQYDVYVLKVGDIIDLDFNSPEIPYRMAARSINVPYDEFKGWDIADALKVMELSSKCLTVLK